MVEGPSHHVVRVFIEFLDFLALHVHLAGQPEDVHEARLVDLGVDDLGGQGDLRDEAGEEPPRARVVSLLLADVAPRASFP